MTERTNKRLLHTNTITFFSIFAVLYSFNLEELQFEGTYDENTYQQIVNQKMDRNLEKIFESFKTEVIDKLDANSYEDSIDILEYKILLFNHDNEWNVEIMFGDNNLSAKFSEFVFYFNGECVTLHIANRNEAIHFLKYNIFPDFFIPTDAIIKKNIDNEKGGYSIEYKISPDYVSLKNCEIGYKTNIAHMFYLLKGLFIISLKCDKYIENGMLKTKLEPQSILGMYKYIQMKIHNNQYGAENDKYHNYILKFGQYLAGEIYTQQFGELVEKDKIEFSLRLHQLFHVMGRSFEENLSNFIFANFLYVSTPEEVMRRNLDKLEEIVYNLGKMLLMLKPEFYSDTIQFDNSPYPDNKETANYEELLEYFRNEVSAKTLSPIAVQQILGICSYYPQSTSIVPEIINSEQNKTRIISAFAKNTSLSKAERDNRKVNLKNPAIWKTATQEFLNKYNPEISCLEFEKKYGKEISSKFEVYRLYELLEKNFLGNTGIDADYTALSLYFIYIKNREAINRWRNKWIFFNDSIKNCNYQKLIRSLNQPRKLKIPHLQNYQICNNSDILFLKNKEYRLFYSLESNEIISIAPVDSFYKISNSEFPDTFLNFDNDFNTNLEIFKIGSLSNEGIVLELKNVKE